MCTDCSVDFEAPGMLRHLDQNAPEMKREHIHLCRILYSVMEQLQHPPRSVSIEMQTSASSLYEV